MSIDKQLQAMTEFLDSEEGKQYMLNYFAELELEEQHNDRWVDRMYNRIKDNIDESIKYLIDWYDSDDYRDREWKMNREPRERLFWVLFDVAKKYGRECSEQEEENYSNMFTGNMWVIGSYVIQVMHGQGSVIRIDKL